MVSSFPADLHQDILVRLPTKSVGRFRCVSKRWLSITTDPRFIIAHSSSISSDPSAFYLSVCRNKRPQLFHLNGDNNTDPSSNSTFSSLLGFGGAYLPQTFHSCNGLILCGIPFTTLLSVCNPTTQDLFAVPVPKQLKLFKFYLAFDPAVSPHIKIFGFGDHRGYCMYRFSSVTMAWERLDGHESFGQINTNHFPRSTFWKGNLCWITDEGLRCLDVEREETSRHPLPGEDGAMQCACLGESGGRLHCIVKNSGASRYRNSGYDVYEMESQSSGWSLLCHVDLGGVVDVHQELRNTDENGDLRLKVLWFLRGGADAVGDRLLLGIPRKIVIYHLKDKSLTTICSGLRPYRGTHSYTWSDIHPHASTLFPLSDFHSVARLLRCEGFHWNPERKVVTASDTNWKRQHPFAEYKRKQVPFRDLEIIFASPTTSDEVDTEIHEREDFNIDNEKELADTQHGIPLKRKRQRVNS